LLEGVPGVAKDARLEIAGAFGRRRFQAHPVHTRFNAVRCGRNFGF
jgi:hypothetical protein